jgi:signal transduction histidine kinase
VARKVDEDGEDVGHILGMAAHELKNLLGPLAMTLQLCERRVRAGEPINVDDLAFARGQVLSLSRLVNDVLDSTRIDTGQFPITLSTLDLCALVQKTLEGFHRAHQRRVICDVPPLPLAVTGDGERLAAVLTNFLDNAVKYAPEPSIIEVRVSCAAERVRIAVSDRGPGIRPEDQPRLFERYFRSPATSGSTRGLGLGLYLCRAIAHHHGGAVGVDSTPGKGSTFWLDLPLGQA